VLPPKEQPDAETRSPAVSDEPGALEPRLREVLPGADLVVVSAGSSVGARDETAGAVAALADVWCHGLSIKPGKPTLLAECAGVPVVGLPGNPLSALVVFRLVGVPLVWRLAGCDTPPPEPSTRAALTRNLPSAAGRLDVVQVALRDGRAEPIFSPSSAAVGPHPRRRLPRRAGTSNRTGFGLGDLGHPLSLNPSVDPAEPVERPQHEPRLADDLRERDRAVAVGPGVDRIVAAVTHDPKLALGDPDGPER
jgi:hypothetical protein